MLGIGFQKRRTTWNGVTNQRLEGRYKTGLEVWLDPKNLPKRPNLRRYEWKTRAVPLPLMVDIYIYIRRKTGKHNSKLTMVDTLLW